MEKRLKTIQREYQIKIEQAQDAQALEALRIALFGSNGEITKATKELAELSKAEKPLAGKLINEIKQTLAKELDQKRHATSDLRQAAPVDLTAPGVKPHVGHLHPITQAIWDITRIFERIGFEVTDTREIDTDWFAFGALNFPENHPARDEWETFFVDQKNVILGRKERTTPESDYTQNTDLKEPERSLSLWPGLSSDSHRNSARMTGGEKVVLTPHTSNAQTRVMLEQKPPIRNITISKTYRRQADVSHLQMFHQFEGIFVDKDVSIAHLKGTLDYFAKQYFGVDRKTRIRPYDFRFTEPSFEVDITCDNCKGKGCRLCKQGWLELGGAGMIHPEVLKNGKIDPKIYNGFAFGWGVERVWMMNGGLNLPDIRQIYTNDLRFNNQF